MGVRTQWANDEKTILVTVIEVPWTWDELEASMTEVYRYIDSVDHQVDTIMDVIRFGRLPKEGLGRSLQLARQAHPRAGRIVLVGSNMLVQMAATAVDRVMSRMPHNTRSILFAASMDEAYHLLN